MARRSKGRALLADVDAEPTYVFPELRNPSEGCALCALRESAPAVLSVAHALLRRGLPYSDIQRRMALVYAEINVPAPREHEYDAHLRGHLNATMLVNRIRVVTEDDEGDPVAQPASPEVRDLREMQSDLASLRSRYLETLEVTPALEPEHIAAATVLFREGRQQIEAFGKLKNSDENVRMAVEEAVRRMLVGLSEPLGARLREFGDVLARGDLERAQAAFVALRGDLKNILFVAFRDATSIVDTEDAPARGRKTG